MYLTPEIAQRVVAALGQLEQSSQVWEDFVTFNDVTMVQTATGPIPSLRALLFNSQMLVANAIANLRGIQTAQIDPLTNQLIITYTDGSTNTAGRAAGEDGEDGISVVNIELYPDPIEIGRVYFQTELSNGVVLRTQNHIDGYNGKSIETVNVVDNQILVTLEGGTALPPLPVEGLTPISINGAEIRDGNLFLKLTNGVELDCGIAADLKGRGVAAMRRTNATIEVSYDDDPQTWFAVGTIKGLVSVTQVNHELFVTYDDAPQTPVKFGELIGFIGAEIDQDSHLILLTNQPAPNNRVDLGLVTNLRPRDGTDGEDGDSIDGVRLEDNTLIFSVGGVELPPVPVSGLTPADIVGAVVREQKLYFQLSNGQEIEAGLAADLRGAGIVGSRLDPDGKLYFMYQDAPTVAVYVGNVPGIMKTEIVNGRLLVTYTTDPLTPVDVGSVRTVSNVTFDGLTLKAIFNDNTESVLGTVRAATDFTVDASGVLRVQYNDTTVQVIGNVQGPRGLQGVGVQSMEISAGGDLMLRWTDGRPEENLGRVRDPILNFIGKQYWFDAQSGQSQFAVPNGGEVVMFVDSVLQPPSAYDLSISNEINLTTPLVGGEKVLFIAYQFVGTTPSGRGVQDIVEVTPGVYSVQLENGTLFTLNTVTPVDPADLPPGVQNIEVLANGDIKVTLTNQTNFIAGSANNAVSIVNAEVDASGNLIIETDDPANRFINAGSVLSGLMIQSASVDQATGHLILTLSSGAVLDAGQTGNFVTQAAIRPADGMLQVTLSNGTVIDAGTVRNPLIGTTFDFICFQGQYEFNVPHGGYQVLVWANGASLQGDDIILTDLTKVKVRSPRDDLDVVRVVLLTAGNVSASSLVGEANAPRGSAYGKNVNGVMGFHALGLMRYGIPYSFAGGTGQTSFTAAHGGSVEVFINGQLLHDDEYTLPDINTVLLNTALIAPSKVKIVALMAPKSMGDFDIANYARIRHLSNGHGGTMNAGAWQIRAINDIKQNTIGLQLNSNRIILPSGRYYVRGWAACNGVSMNAVRLYNQTTGRDLLVGESVFGNRNFTLSFQPGNNLTPIEGYFEVVTQSAVVLQHRSLYGLATYGLGVTGGGHSTSKYVGNIGGGYWTENTERKQSDFGGPAALVDLQFWKVG